MDRDEKLKQLREEFKTAGDERKRQILLEASQLVPFCYQCKVRKAIEPHFPFCSNPCLEQYNQENKYEKKYYDSHEENMALSIPEIQKRLLEMGKRVKAQKQAKQALNSQKT